MTSREATQYCILIRKTRPIANSPEIAFWQRDRLRDRH